MKVILSIAAYLLLVLLAGFLLAAFTYRDPLDHWPDDDD